jgi:hypothetical protein
MPILPDGDDLGLAVQAPVLGIPRADRASQDRDPSQGSGPPPDRAGIEQRLVLDGAGQGGGEVSGGGVRGEHVTVQRLHEDVDGVDVLHSMCPQQGGLCGGRGQAHGTVVCRPSGLTIALASYLPPSTTAEYPRLAREPVLPRLTPGTFWPDHCNPAAGRRTSAADLAGHLDSRSARCFVTNGH